MLECKRCAGENPTNHFADIGKMVELGSGSKREVDDSPLADFLPTLTIKAKDFATELTSHNVIEKDLKGEKDISKEHVENNVAVRKMLNERGVKPEALPPGEDIIKVKRKIEGEDKKVLKDIKEPKRKKE